MVGPTGGTPPPMNFNLTQPQQGAPGDPSLARMQVERNQRSPEEVRIQALTAEYSDIIEVNDKVTVFYDPGSFKIAIVTSGVTAQIKYALDQQRWGEVEGFLEVLHDNRAAELVSRLQVVLDQTIATDNQAGTLTIQREYKGEFFTRLNSISGSYDPDSLAVSIEPHGGLKVEIAKEASKTSLSLTECEEGGFDVALHASASPAGSGPSLTLHVDRELGSLATTRAVSGYDLTAFPLLLADSFTWPTLGQRPTINGTQALAEILQDRRKVNVTGADSLVFGTRKERLTWADVNIIEASVKNCDFKYFNYSGDASGTTFEGCRGSYDSEFSLNEGTTNVTLLGGEWHSKIAGDLIQSRIAVNRMDGDLIGIKNAQGTRFGLMDRALGVPKFQNLGALEMQNTYKGLRIRTVYEDDITGEKHAPWDDENFLKGITDISEKDPRSRHGGTTRSGDEYLKAIANALPDSFQNNMGTVRPFGQRNVAGLSPSVDMLDPKPSNFLEIPVFVDDEDPTKIWKVVAMSYSDKKNADLISIMVQDDHGTPVRFKLDQFWKIQSFGVAGDEIVTRYSWPDIPGLINNLKAKAYEFANRDKKQTVSGVGVYGVGNGNGGSQQPQQQNNQGGGGGGQNQNQPPQGGGGGGGSNQTGGQKRWRGPRPPSSQQRGGGANP